MKSSPLQNPYVVTALALAAAVALFLQFRKPTPPGSVTSKKERPAKTQTASSKVSTKGGKKVTSKPGAMPKPAGKPSGPARPVDVTHINQRLEKWITSPNRDPFGLYPKPSKELTATQTNASQVLTVSAIWRQTGQRLAIINNIVTTENSEILGYRIEQIDASVVRLIGPLGSEQIRLAEFGSTNKPVAHTDPKSAVTAATPTRPPTRPPTGG